MEHQASAHHDEHPPTTIREYVIIGVVLAVITLIELWLSYSGLSHGLMISLLLIFSAMKFIIVVAMFMHLRFDSRLFTRLFIFGFALASALLIALIAMFNFDETRSLFQASAPPPAATAAPQDGGDGDNGEGPADGGALLVKGQPVAEYFSSTCAGCHGQNREGVVGPALTPASLAGDDALYFDTIKNGRPGTAMPAWGATGLSDADIDVLVTFITTVEP
ncbi:MAG: c-type cytochrome [Dehalococcoidia bacterium]|nr:c-type cytochrome [Dehalococcoidia bacterium]